jgi:hydrogenase maturation protease
MDVAFQMRGADEVILIDACRSGSKPGTIFKVPGEELENLPPLTGMHSHSFRWDHALAFGRWLLKDDYPKQITVYLIEITQVEPGMTLTPPVEAAMREMVGRLLDYVSRTKEVVEVGNNGGN